MAAAAANLLSCTSSSSALQCPRPGRTSSLSCSSFWKSGIIAPAAGCSIRCFSTSSSNGRPEGRETEDLAVKEVEQILEEKRRSDLAARIASGEFTVQKSGFVSMLGNGLSKIGPAGKFLGELLVKLGDIVEDGERMAIPQAKGSFRAVGGQAFFIPLYELYLTYGGIFRLTFGPKSFLIVSDPGEGNWKSKNKFPGCRKLISCLWQRKNSGKRDLREFGLFPKTRMGNLGDKGDGGKK
ncbi:protein LUTEIN DEFICIENT 5, chloroplastic-like [Dendrobium catenatum]|uniref:protein LUTEIN DEFICIENT 5, chloroplastic-like n=1 Tax=Dendrobium catenatum TaxID=906689 RepID=UPI0009F34915|nr:protein LUTEIN DEFICIENT 5, chloroplastic-like [Dendrobium catenatum]